MSNRFRKAGFTLAEALLASAVLAMVVTAITIPYSAAARNDVANARLTVASGLAQELMEEILSKPYADPDLDGSGPEGRAGADDVGPDTGESERALFDNIDDYNGFFEAAGSIRDARDNLVSDPAATGLSREAFAGYVHVSGQSGFEDPEFVRVTVEIKFENQPVATLTRLVYLIR